MLPSQSFAKEFFGSAGRCLYLAARSATSAIVVSPRSRHRAGNDIAARLTQAPLAPTARASPE